MPRTTSAPPGDTDDQGRAPAPVPTPMLPQAGEEARGCLFALSQPPLMLFLAVIGMLLGLTGVHDLLFL